MPDNKGEFEKWCRRRRRRRRRSKSRRRRRRRSRSRRRRRAGNDEVPLALPPVCPIAKGRHSWSGQEMAKERKF